MAISPHIARLRAVIGTELILLPSVAVLPFDESDRLLLVRHTGSEQWGMVGGAVEVDEAPADAAVREAREEIGVEVRLRRLVGVVGGADYRVEYPNGDRSAYVSTVYEAEIVVGTPEPDGDEVASLAWFDRRDLPTLDLNTFARAALRDTGYTA